MWSLFRRYLASSSNIGEEETKLRARLLILVIDFSAIAIVLIVLGLLTDGSARPANVGILVATIGILWGLRVMVARGHLVPVSYWLVVLYSLSTSLSLYAAGTIRVPGIAAYVLIVVFAGLMLDWRAIVLTSGLNLLAISLLMLAERAGWLPPANMTITIAQWVVIAVLLSITGLFTYLFKRNIDLALARARLELAERERVEQELRVSETKFRSVVENSLVGMYIDNNRYEFMYVNNEMGRIFGYDPAEMLGMDFRPLLTGESRAMVIERYERRLRGEEAPSRYEFSIVRRNGQVRQVEIMAVVVQDADGQPITIGQLIDITERKEAEADREQLIGELERRNSELERFTYTVSHDLKSPLITIGGFLGFLEKDALSGNAERLKADIARIRDATERMRRLLDDLLELSRVGRLVNPAEQVSFATIVQEALELTHGRLLERGITVEIAPDLPQVYGDRVRLVEVVQNLVDNAAKFMGDQPDPRIRIGVREQNDERVFFVHDNGIGIAPAHQQKIFGLFNKLDRQSEGTGIGLALVKRIIEVHGGRTWVESEGPGHGATFCFTITSMPHHSNEGARQ